MDNKDATKLTHRVRLILEAIDANDMKLTALRVFDKDALLSTLADIAISDDKTRFKAAKALLIYGGEIGIQHALLLIGKPTTNSSMRYYLCGLLGDLGNSNVTSALIERLQSDIDENVRYIAAFSLGKIGDVSALSALKFAAEHDEGTNFQGDPIAEVAKDSMRTILSSQKSR